nr:hypothetical protein [Shinella pollutisoli]
MTIPRLAALAATILLLAGCQTAAERRAIDENKCLDYGFRRGTDAFATCLQRIDLDRRADLRSIRYNTALALGDYGPPVRHYHHYHDRRSKKR